MRGEGEVQAIGVGSGSGLAMKIHRVRCHRKQVNRESAQRDGD